MESSTQKDKYVTFKSGNEFYGLKIQYVNEIIVMQPITAVPEVEDYIKGLINLRGKIIPVIDVRVRFKMEPIEYTDRTCIIVINVKSTVIGEMVMDKLRLLDEVAYVRFASVYREFKDINTFMDELKSVLNK